MAERALLNPQVEKTRYALLQYENFLQDVINANEIRSDVAEDLKEKARVLLENLSRDESKAAEKLVGLIDSLNARLISTGRPHLFPLFPQEVGINQVQNHIIAFEIFLNYRLLTEQISYENQAPLFHKAMILWRDVGVRRTMKEAMVELSNLIDQANRALGDKAASYPLPTPDIYT